MGITGLDYTGRNKQDSQVLLRAIECGSTSVANIINQLNSCTSQVVLQWIPAHSRVISNTLLDWNECINQCLYEVPYLLRHNLVLYMILHRNTPEPQLSMKSTIRLEIKGQSIAGRMYISAGGDYAGRAYSVLRTALVSASSTTTEAVHGTAQNQCLILQKKTLVVLSNS